MSPHSASAPSRALSTVLIFALFATLLTTVVTVVSQEPARAENLIEQQIWPKNSGETWKTLRDGTEQGTGWRQLGFDDSSWSNITLKDYTAHGGVPQGGKRGYYYRNEFELTDVWQITAIKADFYYDDATVMYLNGDEVYRTIRNNLPTDDELSIIQTIPFGGAEDYYVVIPANSNYCEAGCENRGRTDPIDHTLLVEGTNVIGIMGWTTPNSDLGVDLALTVVRDLDATPPGPVIDPVDAQDSELADAISLQMTATTENNPPITWSATGLPDGLAIDESTGLISGSPTTIADSEVTVTASDDVGPTEVTFAWSVVNAPPRLVSPGAQQTPSFNPVNLVLDASDPDGGALTFAVSGLPPGIALDDQGVFSGASSAEGAYTVTVDVTDDEGAEESISFPWQIAEPPIDIVDPGSQEGVFDQPAELTLSASDPAGAVTLDLEGLPPGLEFDPATNTVTGKPSAVGTFDVLVSGSGPSGTSIIGFQWVVPNVVPVVTVPETQVSLARLDVAPQLASAADPDGGPISASADGLPPGVDFDADTGVFSGQPTEGGVFTVTVSVTDDEEGVGSASFEWEVLDVEKPVRINEVVASNDESLLDFEEDTPDWIELHNSTPVDVSLDGWMLQDATGQWAFPAVEITAGEYLVVFASDKDIAEPGQELHTNFKLSKEGDSLVMTDANGFVVDQIGSNAAEEGDEGDAPGLPRQFGDVSYGLGGDQDGELGYLETTTPRAPNSPLGTDFAPVLRPFTDRMYNVGEPVNESIDGFDPDGEPITYGLTPAPSGVTLALATGELAGVARRAGEWSTVVSMTDASNNRTEQEANWYVLPAPEGDASLVLNEYNAVSPSGELFGGADPAFVEGELGNGGDWYEFVVVQDGLDIRGWTIELWDRDNKEELLVNSASLVFADAYQLGDLPAGTIITIAEDHPDDLSFDPDNGDWHINLQSTEMFEGEFITGESQENFNSSRSNQNVIIRNADGVNVTPVVGETERWDEVAGGVGGGEVMSLCIDPSTTQVDPIADYRDNGLWSSFGQPNTCTLPGEDPAIPDDDIVFNQDLSALRNAAVQRELGAPPPTPVPPTPVPTPEIPGIPARPLQDVTAAVSCLAGNGRVDLNIVNSGSNDAVYRIEFEGLSARQTTVLAGDWWRMPITGRADRDYQVNVLRDGDVAWAESITVTCDTDPPMSESPEVQIVNACRANNGYVLFQFVNPDAAQRGWVIEFDGVTNRSTGAGGHAAAVRAVTGRPDGDHVVRVRANGVPIYSATVSVACD